MMIQGVYNGRTVKEVTFLDAANDSSDDLTAAAFKATGETEASTFGTQVRRYPDEGSAMVTIFID